MQISYEKMTEERYLQLTLFRQAGEEKREGFDLLIDMSKIKNSSCRNFRISLPDDCKMLNINFIQLNNDFFHENLSFLRSLLMVFCKRKLVHNVNIRIYSQHYAFYQKEIDSSIFCDSKDGFGNNNCRVSFRKILLAIALRKIVGLRLSGIAYKAYRYLKKLFS
ncbi:MAG: hypothetical protein ACR5LG_07790 [Sodalis sp. (in: enterobacteria)]|uniref:hypothetical protein n=1 Tax=Sodalis sp. (in: enterobacteria) TaxID=1898979 RepID=UPI003F3A322F